MTTDAELYGGLGVVSDRTPWRRSADCGRNRSRRDKPPFVPLSPDCPTPALVRRMPSAVQVWDEVLRFREVMMRFGAFMHRREAQRQKQLWNNLQSEVMHRLRTWPGLQDYTAQLEKQVSRGAVTPRRACYKILDLILTGQQPDSKG